MEKWTYWTDKVIEEVKQRVKKSEILQKTVKKSGYVVYDEKTPSGKIHIGSARGWVIHDIIAKTMRDHGLKGRFVLSADDIDALDTVPTYLPKEKFEKFLGMPLRNVPSPESGYESYADYYFSQCTEFFDKWGIEAELESTGERYIKGDFNWAIKTVLDNVEKIHRIYKKIYGKAATTEKMPFSPICEKCGRIGTTLAYEWDREREIVKYSCEPDLVKWARGCGYRGEISPYNGNGKMPWKVEWASKWPTVGVLVETAGKDHFTKGGARTIAVAISCEVFNYPPPWPSTCENDGRGYEFFLVEGKKMSTSKGIGAGFAEISESVPPQILRFLMVKTRPETSIDFKEEHIPLIYNEFEKHEKIYFGLEKVDKREEANAKRAYELSFIGKISKGKPVIIPFHIMVEIARILPERNQLEFALEKLREFGYIKKMSEDVKEKIIDQLSFAKKWVGDFEKPEVTELKVSKTEKNAIKEITKVIESEINGEVLQNKIFQIAKNSGIQPAQLFKTIYRILLKSERGPRLGPYIIEIGKDDVIKKLKEIIV